MVCYLQETYFIKSQKTEGLCSEWKPQTGCSVCRLQAQNNQRRKEGYCISVKAAAHQRDMTIINIATQSNRAPSDVFHKDRFCRSTEKHKLHKEERENLVWAWPQRQCKCHQAINHLHSQPSGWKTGYKYLPLKRNFACLTFLGSLVLIDGHEGFYASNRAQSIDR